MADTRRVALVGIDGSGKTSVARLLRGRAAGPESPAVLHAVRPHDNAEGPLTDLARRLQAVSEVADRLDSPELKIGLFYLQLCTYPIIEGEIRDRRHPAVILVDRHPIVDSMVYLPLYGRLAAGRPARPGPPADLAERVAAVDPAALPAALDWAERLGQGRDVWAVGRDLLALYADPLDAQLKRFRELLGTGLPDEVVLLDVRVDQALSRLGARGRELELHETAPYLTAVRNRFEQVLGWLAETQGVRVRRIDNGERTPEEAADEIAKLIAE